MYEQKDRYIKSISHRCEFSYGELLLDCMDTYNVNSLSELSLAQLIEFCNSHEIYVDIHDKSKKAENPESL